MLIYSPDENNLNNLIAKLRAFTEDGRRKSRNNATRVKAVSGVCSTFNSVIIFFDMYGLHTKYSDNKYSLKSINEDVCRVFQRPFACMNDPEIKQICTRTRIFLGLRTEHILKPIKLKTHYHKIRSFVQSVAPTNTYRNNLVRV